MDHFNAHSKPSNFSAFTPLKQYDRSCVVTYGDGQVYTGPLTAQNYEYQQKSINETGKCSTPQDDERNHVPSSLSSSINSISLTSSPSTDTMNVSTHYQFKVMLLGDSGVGKTKIFSFKIFYSFLFTYIR